MSQQQTRFGIGEWYGRSFVHLSPSERQKYAELQFLKKKERPDQPCLPRMHRDAEFIPCTKAGGVCSLRLYQKDDDSEEVSPVTGRKGVLRTVFPYRFEEHGLIYEWIGETLLEHSQPFVIGQVGFLRPHHPEKRSRKRFVGKIDNILVHPDADPLQWCALEIQSVYFSGGSMRKEFRKLREPNGALPFPAASRRPDYRSSGPKRLMPQLQTKVPALRRWGKKMAVVIDEGFYHALGEMDHVDDVSNCDIAWFVVRYEEEQNAYRLTQGRVQFTTLERAVEGLTAGRPVSLREFEARIRKKLKR